MPANIVKPGQEAEWERAKKQAAKEGHGDDYAYITAIFKKMVGKSMSMLLVGDEMKPMTPEQVDEALQKGATVSEEEELHKAFLGGYGMGSEEWVNKFMSYRDLYLEALQCVKDKMELEKQQAEHQKAQPSWRELEELPRSEREQRRKEMSKQRERYETKFEELRARAADLEKQLIDKRIDEAKARVEKSEVSMPLGVSGLDQYLAKAEGAPVKDDGKPGQSLKETPTSKLKSTYEDLKARLKETSDPGLQERANSIRGELKRRGADVGEKQSKPKEKIEKMCGPSHMNKAGEQMDEEKDKKPGEDEASDKEQGKDAEQNGGKKMEKSMAGMERLDEYLEKAGVVGKDESGGKGPPSSMPTGSPSESQLTGAGAEDGGPVADVGKTSGPNTQPPKHQSQIGRVDPAKTEVLSSDDAQAAKYVEEGYMGEGMRKSMTDRTHFTRHELDASVARQRAARERQLRKGEEDILVTGRPPHPFSHGAVHTGTDARAEALQKSEFYQGVSPTLAPPHAVVSQSVLCKSCSTEHSAMLTACPCCGEGVVQSQVLPNQRLQKGGVILEKSIQAPGLRRARRDDDLVIG